VGMVLEGLKRGGACGSHRPQASAVVGSMVVMTCATLVAGNGAFDDKFGHDSFLSSEVEPRR
jgi:hypothetical protein